MFDADVESRADLRHRAVDVGLPDRVTAGCRAEMKDRQGLPRKAAANTSPEPKGKKENGAIDVMWSGT